MLQQRLQEGVFNVDKPAGWTSHDVVAKIRATFKFKKVGHTGTLDPQATGVLPVCFGKGTKIVSFIMETEKEYEATLRLGEETDTQDATGKVVRTSPVPAYLSEKLFGTLSAFVGEQLQIPPMYSAIKVGGRPLYEAARQGIEVSRTPRPVTIQQIQLLGLEGRDVSFRVTCSKGTYIRTLCADIGLKLGVGGHLLSLRRTRVGNFRIADAVALDTLCELGRSRGVGGLSEEGTETPFEEEWERKVYPLNDVLAGWPAVSVSEEQCDRIAHGIAVAWEGVIRSDPFEKGSLLRLLSPAGALMGIGRALIGSQEVRDRGRAPFYKIEAMLGRV
jgi:tRNA pseudouridine55 synthase